MHQQYHPGGEHVHSRSLILRQKRYVQTGQKLLGYTRLVGQSGRYVETHSNVSISIIDNSNSYGTVANALKSFACLLVFLGGFQVRILDFRGRSWIFGILDFGGR